jgi:hypothetical protein
MSDDEQYVAVRGRVKEVRPRAVLFVVGESVERGDWVPRSLIHGADDKALDGKFAGEETTLRMFKWKARELGFEDERDDRYADRDLFGDPEC